MTPKFDSSHSGAIPVYLIEAGQQADWAADQPGHVASWIAANNFTGELGSHLLVPATDGTPSAVLVGYGTHQTRARGRFHLAGVAAKLPEGTYAIASSLPSEVLEQEALGWLLSGYQFDRYKTKPAKNAALLAPSGIDARRVEAIAAGECLTRDLINTPTNDMGPDALEQEARDLAADFDAEVSVTSGTDLITENFPLIHAVGRASASAPRLIDMRWGTSGPSLTLVGKGVCFDTGGLNLKPGASMGLMKKDMGGAATVLGLARQIMALDLPLQLRVLIPAVENSVAGNSFRPGDILTARNGRTVEINNTDAEGRLVLADALSYGAEAKPDLMISMATLTGAARVAVGPDLTPFYCDDDSFAQHLADSAARVADPVWRMPFWTPYEKMIEPDIADLDNAPAGGFAGSITAALFLRRFTAEATYAHFDVYGWCPSSLPARPKGGVGQGARAILDALPDVLSL